MNIKEKTLHYFSGMVIGKKKVKKYNGRFRDYYELEVEITGKPEIKII
jgi:hypothetical protein